MITIMDQTLLEQRRKGSLSDTLRDMFVNQLAHELKNFTLYNTFSVYYSCKGLEKLGKYYKARADEELVHQQWIMDYLSTCDAVFSYPDIQANNLEGKITDDVAPFRLTVDREIETTELLKALCRQAVAEGDFLTLSFLQGSAGVAKLIPEQIEEESLSRSALDIMLTDDHILKKEDQVYDLYFSGRNN